ncbi:hypothetical protein ACE38W_15120 [Chitinophaga sp. Hz27]|uniref:hypothetical protein n=1 Tax=Chitinophaga sp. Hz27 TaxID=3347169 RepID=UPI0035D591F7
MRLSCYIAMGLLAMASCKPPLDRVTRLENLPVHQVTVNTSRDTTLQLPEGLKVHIPAGALSSKNKEVKLDLMEALTIADMIKSGLTTTSNGHLLSSGGMFVILPAKGEEIKIVQPLTVEIPSSKISDGMQIYQGVMQNGQMNWMYPTPIVDSSITSAPQATHIEEVSHITRTDLRTADTISDSGKHNTATEVENSTAPKMTYNTIRISNFGWKDIDVETHNLAAAKACKLSVSLTQPADSFIHIFLIIPDYRILSTGRLSGDGKSCGFYDIDSNLHLPMNKSAYIIATGETGSKFYFGSTAFVTDEHLDLKLDVKESDPKVYEETIAKICADKGLAAEGKVKNDPAPLLKPADNAVN